MLSLSTTHTPTRSAVVAIVVTYVVIGAYVWSAFNEPPEPAGRGGRRDATKKRE